MPVTSAPFGVTEAGEPVQRHILSDGRIELTLLDWGARVQSF